MVIVIFAPQLPRVAGGYFCFFAAVLARRQVSVLCKMQNGKMILCEMNGKMNMRNCGYSANGKMEAVATDDSWLTAMAVSTDSCRRLPKSSLNQHVADIKNIASNDQATLRVYQILQILCSLSKFSCTRSRMKLHDC